MHTSLHASRIGAMALAMLLAACTDAVSPPASPSAPPVLSRVGGASSTRHVMDFGNGIPADLAAQVAARGGELVRVDEAIGMAVTSGLSDAAADAIAGRAHNSRDIVARWVPTLEEMQARTAADASLALAPEYTPKPPQTAVYYVLGYQWNMRRIHADQAWIQGKTGLPTVRVAIVDSGLDPDHIDQNGTVIDQATSTFFTPSISPEPGPRWMDDHFHGTFVGGIVTSNNIGVAGVAPNVTLVAVKVINAAGVGSYADMLSAIIYATNVKVQVINLSLGAYIPRGGREAALLLSLTNRVINYAHSRDVLVISASGNDNIDLQHDKNYIQLPCEAGVHMCISATGITDTRASYSNYGTDAINVAAPGGDVDGAILSPCSSHSVMPGLAACKTRNRYLFGDGTSAAAPHVAALGAFLQSQFAGQLNASQLITSIEQHADDLGKPGADPDFGKGRINVVATVNDQTP